MTDDKARAEEKRIVQELCERAEYHLYASTDIQIDRGKFEYFANEIVTEALTQARKEGAEAGYRHPMSKQTREKVDSLESQLVKLKENPFYLRDYKHTIEVPVEHYKQKDEHIKTLEKKIVELEKQLEETEETGKKYMEWHVESLKKMKDEREACAKVAESKVIMSGEFYTPDDYPELIATAIRARTNP